jgi:hypothetical protein
LQITIPDQADILGLNCIGLLLTQRGEACRKTPQQNTRHYEFSGKNHRSLPLIPSSVVKKAFSALPRKDLAKTLSQDFLQYAALMEKIFVLAGLYEIESRKSR